MESSLILRPLVFIVDAPFGGYKHSGIGREASAIGIEEFLEVKAVGGWND